MPCTRPNDPAVAQALNVNIGPHKPGDLDAMWQEIRAGEFPRMLVSTRSVRQRSIHCRRPRQARGVGVYAGAFHLKGKQPEDWIKLKNGFMEKVLKNLAPYATNLTDENIT